MSFDLGFKKNKQSASQTNKPYFTDTGYSSWSGTKLNLDPSIRGFEDTMAQQLAGIYGDTGDLIKRYSANENPYFNARVNPLLEARDSALGSARMSGGLRGLSGSSFLDKNIAGLRGDFASKIGDAGALATNESLGAVTSLQQFRAALSGQLGALAQQRAQRELAQLGLGSQSNMSGTSSGFSFNLGGNYVDGAIKPVFRGP